MSGLPETWQASELPHSRVPDIIGAQRVFKVMSLTAAINIKSVVHNFTWRLPGLNYATCLKVEPCTQDVPGQHCTCGFYGYYLPDTHAHPTASGYNGTGLVLAVAEASGAIEYHPLGLRAAEMKLLALHSVERGDFVGINTYRRLLEFTDRSGLFMGVPLYGDLRQMTEDFPPQPVDEILGMSALEAREDWTRRMEYQPLMGGQRSGRPVAVGGIMAARLTGPPRAHNSWRSRRSWRP